MKKIYCVVVSVSENVNMTLFFSNRVAAMKFVKDSHSCQYIEFPIYSKANTVYKF